MAGHCPLSVTSEKMKKLQPLIMVSHRGHRTKPRIQRCSSFPSIRNRIVLFNHLNVLLFVFPGIFFLSNQKKKNEGLCKGKKIQRQLLICAALNPFIFRKKTMIKINLSYVCKPCSLPRRLSFGSSRNPPQRTSPETSGKNKDQSQHTSRSGKCT